MLKKLTGEELALVNNADIIRTKSKVLGVVADGFGDLANQYETILSTSLLDEFATRPAKISKGEQYQGLPYIILDYPRSFEKKNVFAVRSFFWWGNFFSITLQLSGEPKEKYQPALQGKLYTTFSDWYINSSDEPWTHHFNTDNYLPISATENIQLTELPFIKLAKKIPLTQWDDVEIFFIQNFNLLFKALSY